MLSRIRILETSSNCQCSNLQSLSDESWVAVLPNWKDRVESRSEKQKGISPSAVRAAVDFEGPWKLTSTIAESSDERIRMFARFKVSQLFRAKPNLTIMHKYSPIIGDEIQTSYSSISIEAETWELCFVCKCKEAEGGPTAAGG